MTDDGFRLGLRAFRVVVTVDRHRRFQRVAFGLAALAQAGVTALNRVAAGGHPVTLAGIARARIEAALHCSFPALFGPVPFGPAPFAPWPSAPASSNGTP